MEEARQAKEKCGLKTIEIKPNSERVYLFQYSQGVKD